MRRLPSSETADILRASDWSMARRKAETRRLAPAMVEQHSNWGAAHQASNIASQLSRMTTVDDREHEADQ